jgi:hypothetical protein
MSRNGAPTDPRPEPVLLARCRGDRALLTELARHWPRTTRSRSSRASCTATEDEPRETEHNGVRIVRVASTSYERPSSRGAPRTRL